MISVLPKIKAVVGDHPDPMIDPKQNPDLINYKIDKTPVFIITGTIDFIEPKLSGWEDFIKITSPNKVFVDVSGKGHLEPLLFRDEAIPIVNFYRAFVYKTISPEYFYISQMDNDLKIAPVGSGNTGDDKIGYVACVHSGPVIAALTVPAGYEEQYCKGGAVDE